jgi:ADP-ribosylglycohydrolase
VIGRAIIGMDPEFGVDTEVLGQKISRALVTWRRDGEMLARAPQSGTLGAAERLILGVPWRDAGDPTDQHAVVALRAVALGLPLAPSEVAMPARVSAWVTHHDSACLEAATFAAWITSRLARGATLDRELIEDARRMIAGLGVSESVAEALADALADSWFKDVPTGEIFGDEEAAPAEDGIRSAITAALRGASDANGFEKAVSLAARASSDPPTAAALAGALIGASRGFSAIPKDLLLDFEDLDLLLRLADALMRHAAELPAETARLAS